MTDLAGALARLNDLIAQRLGIAPTGLFCLHVLDRAGTSTVASSVPGSAAPPAWSRT
ncbi:hypothetical protein [Actinoallomurus iriomotensis]|uniref:Uncharacterized protein n=1 Tax=Actinoallomurus iriomotensis TaxID=478107 RepID=A0A9W6RFE7_9ACTN|nr:hypothetical protein [Actinoallomurus iriomotensis]GLY73635.1 hypothetical protein Airi01_019020 [Actinoallomurus iriomotensis]